MAQETIAFITGGQKCLVLGTNVWNMFVCYTMFVVLHICDLSYEHFLVVGSVPSQAAWKRGVGVYYTKVCLDIVLEMCPIGSQLLVGRGLFSLSNNG